MAGKTAIDTDLRDDLLNYLGFVLMDADKRGINKVEKISADAKELFYRLKPQRVRARKVVETAEHIQPST